MSITKRIAIFCFVLALAVGAYQHQDAVNNAVGTVAGWVGAKAKVEKAWIVRESKQKHTADQVAVINGASRIGIRLVDPQDIGPDNKTPADLIPVIKAADGKELPVLVRKFSNGKLTAVPMPTPIVKLQEAVK